MNLRRQRPEDSMNMLLDTMCNTFGGIILLAVLVTLLTSKERHELKGASSDSQEMLQRRWSLAQTNLQQALELLASLKAKAADERWKKQLQLLAERKELQDTLQDTREAIQHTSKELDEAGANDPTERVKILNARLAAAQARKLDAQNNLAASEQKNKEMVERIAGLNREITEKFNETVRPLRFPKEYESGKEVVYIIVQYGRVYPCRNADMSKNETGIKWSTSVFAETAVPIEGKGLHPVANARELEAYFRSQPKDNVYMAFIVVEDSFATFNRAKQMAVSSGLAYGWIAFRTREPIIFSAFGSRPAAQ